MDTVHKKLISSKEILLKTGISRATLNNYIKMGFLPRPVVMRPPGGMQGVKKIGYFPRDVLERIRRVQRYKKQGLSMEEIKSRFKAADLNPEQKGEGRRLNRGSPNAGKQLPVMNKTLHLTLESLSHPAYFLDNRFHVVWVNDKAIEKIFLINAFGQGSGESMNVFQWIFNWELHNVLQNWKDLLRLHINDAKKRKSPEWLEHAYAGISDAEKEILREFYEKASAQKEKDIYESHIRFLRRDGVTDSYRVFTLSFHEGRLFVYLSREGLDH
jgi:DNA-binding transcriptional MerR regulator